MKKLLICLMALMLLLSATALAEAKVEKETEIKSYITLCTATNCYIASSNGKYHLYDADGNALSAGYKDLTPYKNGQYIEAKVISNSETLNCYALLDAAGQEVLPMGYADFLYLDGGWVLAYVLEPTDDEVGEYKDGNGNQYLVARTDVVYNGSFIGSLSREEYIPSYNEGSKGAFMYVKTANNHLYWLDSSFNRVDVFDDDYVSISEFDGFYSNKNVLHNPTQQDAFVAGCTLTKDQVLQHVWYDDKTDSFVDLQGNVLAKNMFYDSVYFRTDYMEVRRNGLRGIVAFDGTEIVPPIYKDIAYGNNNYFESGYNAVLDEKGRLSYIDKAGNVTASVDYELNYSDYKGYTSNAPIVAVNNMGKYLLITATHGELPTKYEDYVACGSNRTIISVKKDGMWGVVDMAGNTVVPFEYKNSLQISADGTLIYGSKGLGTSMLYNISYGEDGAVIEAAETPAQSNEAAEETALPDGAWVCACGSVNTGKFCGECGTAMPTPTPEPTPEPTPAPTEVPAEDGSWTCSCGSANTGKFCPECGTKKPEAPAEPQCANCGYKPEGTTPKFCPECGTKF